MDEKWQGPDRNSDLIVEVFAHLGLAVRQQGQGWVTFGGPLRDLRVTRDWRDGWLDATFVNRPAADRPPSSMPLRFLTEAVGGTDRAQGWSGYSAEATVRLLRDLATRVRPFIHLVNTEDPDLWITAAARRDAASRTAASAFATMSAEREVASRRDAAARAWDQQRWADVVAELDAVEDQQPLRLSEGKRRDIAQRKAGGGR